MRCKGCEYRLWNIRSRQCPECGRPFLPSEFEFIPNAVQFLCPHCGQAYYGTAANGHLSPRAFACVQCGQRIDMDEMVLVPRPDMPEEQTVPAPCPWLVRKKIGFYRALFRTIGQAMVSPGKLMRSVPLDARSRDSLSFAANANVLIYLVILVTFASIPILVGMSAASGAGGGGAPPAVAMLFGLACAAGGALVGLLVYVAVWGLLAHGLLRLTGTTAAGLERTYQALCYSSGANAASAVPCVGPYVGWLWWLVSAVIMIKDGQQVHGGRAALAVLALPALTLLAVFGLYGMMLYSLFAGVGPFGINASSIRTEADTVLVALRTYSDEHAGAFPPHGVALVTEDYLSAYDLISADLLTAEEDVTVAGMTLDQVENAAEASQAAVVKSATAALPSPPVAHRLGDFVFTYHGIDPQTADPGLWLVVMSPDPDTNFARSFGRFVPVGDAGGNVSLILANNFPQALTRQNALRAANNLPPLPDPTSVRH